MTTHERTTTIERLRILLGPGATMYGTRHGAYCDLYVIAGGKPLRITSLVAGALDTARHPEEGWLHVAEIIGDTTAEAIPFRLARTLWANLPDHRAVRKWLRARPDGAPAEIGFALEVTWL